MGESYFWKPFAQGVATPIVLIGGTNLLLKDFKVSNPYLYWGGLAASSAIVLGILADKIKVPILNAETTMTVEHKDGSKYRYSETDPIYGEMGGIVGHVSEIKDEKDTPYQKIYGRDVTRGHNFHLNHADYTDSDSSHFGKPLEDDEEFTTMQVRIGSPSGSTTSWTTAFNVECIGDEDNLYHLTYDLEYEIKDRVKQWNPNTIEDPRNPPSKTTMQIVIGSPSGSTTSWYRAFEVLAHDEMYGEDLSYLSGEIHDLVVERVKRWNGDEVIYDAESFEAQGKPTWAGYCPFCKKWRTTEWSKKYGGDTVCAKIIPDPHYNSGDEALFVRENFARKGGKWIRPKENICGVVLEKKQSKNAETFNSDSHTDSFMADMPVNAVKNNDGWYIPSVHRNDYKEIFKNWKPSKYPYEKRITQDSVNEACNSCGKEKVHYQFYLPRTNSVNPKMRFIDNATYCQYDTNSCGGNICGDCAENASCENCGADICTYCEEENNYDHSDLVCVDCREFNESLEDD